MDVFEHGTQAPPLASTLAGASATVALPPESDRVPREDVQQETVFTVLAGHARTRARSHLWITAWIGLIDAVALMVARPTLWWAAAACAAVSAYATWGLIDRALAPRSGSSRNVWSLRVLRGVQGLTIIAGVGAALAAAFGLLGAALGNSGPPG